MVTVRSGCCWFQRRGEVALVGIQCYDSCMRVVLAFEEQNLESTVVGCLAGEEVRLNLFDVKIEIAIFGYRQLVSNVHGIFDERLGCDLI